LKLAGTLPDDAKIQMRIVGPALDPDKMNNTSVAVNLGKKVGDGAARFEKAGYKLMEENGKVIFDGFTWNFKDKGLKQRFAEQFTVGDPDKPLYIDILQTPRERMPKEVFYIPALLLLGLIIFLQRQRHPAFEAQRDAATTTT